MYQHWPIQGGGAQRREPPVLFIGLEKSYMFLKRIISLYGYEGLVSSRYVEI
jgi:hypothetical protein